MATINENYYSIGWIECYYLCNKYLTELMADRYLYLCTWAEREPDQEIMDYINFNIYPEIDF